MLKFKIRIRDEDKFGILLQLIKQRINNNIYSVEEIETVDDSNKDYMFFIIDYKHPKFINQLLITFRDISDIIGFPIEYCFIYNKLEGHTATDNITQREIPYNVLNSFGIC